MPIAGISDVIRLPRLGKIKLGLKKEGDKTYPTPTDYFVCPPEVQEVYGEKPKHLDIMFPIEDEGVFAPQWLRRYSQTRGCICWGDGRTANRLIDKATGAMVSKDTREVSMKPVPCDPDACPEYQSKNCRRLMNLQFLLPQVKGLGIWQLNTSSRNSILNINGMVDVIRAVCGRIAMIPLTLSLEPQEVVPPGGTKKVVRVLQLRANLTLAAIQRLGTVEPTRILLPAPDLGTDEDLYPAEVTEEEATAEAPDDELFPPLTEQEERDDCWQEVRGYLEKTEDVTTRQLQGWFKKHYQLSLSPAEVNGQKPPPGATLEALKKLRDNLRSYQAKRCPELAKEMGL